MNKERRAKIEDIRCRAVDLAAELEDLMDEEQGYLDVMPEAFANGERGETTQAHIDKMSTAIDSLRDVENELDGMD